LQRLIGFFYGFLDGEDYDRAADGAASGTCRRILRRMEKNDELNQQSSLDDRIAYSPGEFAALFGKHRTWGYRQLYRGSVKAITQCGRIMIPRGEVDRLLCSAKPYNGKIRPARLMR
jgi:hypothetical protein